MKLRSIHLDSSSCMMTSSNGKIFRVTVPLWGEGGSNGHRWIPLIKGSDAELWYFFYLRLNKRLSNKSRPQRFQTPSHSLWRHCNARLCLLVAGGVICRQWWPYSVSVYHIEAETKLPLFCRRHFQTHFFNVNFEFQIRFDLNTFPRV